MGRENVMQAQIRESVLHDPKRRVRPITDATAGALTITAAMIRAGYLNRDPNGASRSDVMPTAALLIAGLPNPAIGDMYEFTINNNADAAEVITVTAGTGMTFGSTGRTHTLAQNLVQSYWIQITGVASGSEAYVLWEK